MSRYWPDYLRSMGLWSKPKSEWPLSVIREQIAEQVSQHILEKAAYCDDDDAEWIKTVEMYLEWENF
jgi:hypothetical protein